MSAASKRSQTVACRGFSLLELLIVVSLILIMFVMTHGSRTRSRQQRQLQQCNRNLQSIFLALDIYANDHEGVFPIATNAATSEAPLSTLVPRYTSLASTFICPGSGDRALPAGEAFADERISYAYYMGRRRSETNDPVVTDEQVDTSPKIKGRPLFSPDGTGAGSNHKKLGGNLLFADGHVEKAGPSAPYSLLTPSGVTLLNPKR